MCELVKELPATLKKCHWSRLGTSRDASLQGQQVSVLGYMQNRITVLSVQTRHGDSKGWKTSVQLGISDQGIVALKRLK